MEVASGVLLIVSNSIVVGNVATALALNGPGAIISSASFSFTGNTLDTDGLSLSSGGNIELSAVVGVSLVDTVVSGANLDLSGSMSPTVSGTSELTAVSTLTLDTLFEAGSSTTLSASSLAGSLTIDGTVTLGSSVTITGTTFVFNEGILTVGASNRTFSHRFLLCVYVCAVCMFCVLGMEPLLSDRRRLMIFVCHPFPGDGAEVALAAAMTLALTNSDGLLGSDDADIVGAGAVDCAGSEIRATSGTFSVEVSDIMADSCDFRADASATLVLGSTSATTAWNAVGPGTIEIVGDHSNEGLEHCFSFFLLSANLGCVPSSPTFVLPVVFLLRDWSHFPFLHHLLFRLRTDSGERGDGCHCCRRHGRVEHSVCPRGLHAHGDGHSGMPRGCRLLSAPLSVMLAWHHFSLPLFRAAGVRCWM